jgi:hypothetical protein
MRRLSKQCLIKIYEEISFSPKYLELMDLGKYFSLVDDGHNESFCFELI